MPTVVFRVDGNPEIGAGHVMRCLALAQALEDIGGKAVFLSSAISDAYEKRLTNERCIVLPLQENPYGKEDALETATMAKNHAASWIVLDGYRFDDAYQHTLKKEGVNLLVIDDHRCNEKHSCDILLNQNPQCGNIYTNTEADSLLLGTRFTMLRREYREWKRKEYAVSRGTKRILVTLGGSDPHNITPVVLRALLNIAIPVEITVILGGANPYASEVLSMAKKATFPIDIQTDVQDMPATITGNDLAISAAGSTCYELAYMGIPTLTIIAAKNHNQDNVAEGLEAAGATINLGMYDSLQTQNIVTQVTQLLANTHRLEQMSMCGRKMIDGNGAHRVLMRMTGSRLRLRSAREEDCKMIWEWANDPETRKASFSSDPIPWEDHREWFRTKLADVHHRFFVAYNDRDEPVGQVRFDCTGKNAVISVSIAPTMRGKKYATELVTLGCRAAFADCEINVIDAFIKPENKASVAVFEKSGFTARAPTNIKGRASFHYMLSTDTLRT